jgi:hypothetical protein
LPSSSDATRARSRIRLEFYLPERPERLSYRVAREWLIRELTYSQGGTSRIESLSGTYLSREGQVIADRVNLVWCDTILSWNSRRERAELLAYAAQLKRFLEMHLVEEEAVLIAMVPVYHLLK